LIEENLIEEAPISCYYSTAVRDKMPSIPPFPLTNPWAAEGGMKSGRLDMLSLRRDFDNAMPCPGQAGQDGRGVTQGIIPE
jgi:hypothetical protein